MRGQDRGARAQRRLAYAFKCRRSKVSGRARASVFLDMHSMPLRGREFRRYVCPFPVPPFHASITDRLFHRALYRDRVHFLTDSVSAYHLHVWRQACFRIDEDRQHAVGTRRCEIAAIAAREEQQRFNHARSLAKHRIWVPNDGP